MKMYPNALQEMRDKICRKKSFIYKMLGIKYL